MNDLNLPQSPVSATHRHRPERRERGTVILRGIEKQGLPGFVFQLQDGGKTAILSGIDSNVSIGPSTL